MADVLLIRPSISAAGNVHGVVCVLSEHSAVNALWAKQLPSVHMSNKLAVGSFDGFCQVVCECCVQQWAYHAALRDAASDWLHDGICTSYRDVLCPVGQVVV